MNYLIVFVGGGMGSMLRFWITKWQSSGNSFPIGTFLSNLLACFILGFLVYSMAGRSREELGYILLAAGFCGGFSTFSTFSMESVELLQQGNWMMALVYVLSSVLSGLLAFALAYWLGSQLLNS